MLSKKVKDWFGEGEWDVDLMIQMRVITEEHILHMYNKEHTEKEGLINAEQVK